MGSMPNCTAGDYNDSSEDIIKMVEGAGNRLAGQ
jgi:hypothetical protein